MKKTLLVVALVLACCSWVATAVAASEQQGRSLTGTVLDSSEHPVANAIVYLKNTKTLAMKTFVTGPDGEYRFLGLSPNVDYEVRSELNGKRSDAKTLSSFDSRPTARINLKIK